MIRDKKIFKLLVEIYLVIGQRPSTIEATKLTDMSIKINAKIFFLFWFHSGNYQNRHAKIPA